MGEIPLLALPALYVEQALCNSSVSVCVCLSVCLSVPFTHCTAVVGLLLWSQQAGDIDWLVPSVHWNCLIVHCLQCFDAVGWRQEGHPACKKKQWWGAGMVICLERGADLHMAQLMLLLLTVSCFSNSRLVLPFWYRLTWVVPDKGPFQTGVCVCCPACSSSYITPACCAAANADSATYHIIWSYHIVVSWCRKLNTNLYLMHTVRVFHQSFAKILDVREIKWWC